MIRNVTPDDIQPITDIYNDYIRTSVATFETTPLTVKEMGDRIMSISREYPYFVCVENERVVGFCCAHRWKDRDAYDSTLETTVYLSPRAKGRGLGRAMMERLIDECRRRGFFALIACITGCNDESIALHRKLGFKQVSLFEQVGYKLGQRLDVVDYELRL